MLFTIVLEESTRSKAGITGCLKTFMVFVTAACGSPGMLIRQFMVMVDAFVAFVPIVASVMPTSSGAAEHVSGVVPTKVVPFICHWVVVPAGKLEPSVSITKRLKLLVMLETAYMPLPDAVSVEVPDETVIVQSGAL